MARRHRGGADAGVPARAVADPAPGSLRDRTRDPDSRMRRPDTRCFPIPRLAADLCRAYNDWLADTWLSRDARLRATIVVPAQDPAAAAAEIHRLAGRDEFVGVFLPGGARIPYGNPIYDPIWRAADGVRSAGRVHVHYEGVGISGPLTGAGHPDFYIEYHALLGSEPPGPSRIGTVPRRLRALPRSQDAADGGRAGGLPGPAVAAGHQLEVVSQRDSILRRRPSEYVWDHVRFTHPAARVAGRAPAASQCARAAAAWETLCFASDYPHWDFDEPNLTLRLCPPNGARRFSVPTRSRSSASTYRRSAHCEPAAPARVQRDVFASAHSVPVEIGAHRIVVTLTDRGPFAYADRCPHRGAPMSCRGADRDRLVDGDGRLVSGPARLACPLPVAQVGLRPRDRKCVVDPRLRLRTYSVVRGRRGRREHRRSRESDRARARSATATIDDGRDSELHPREEERATSEPPRLTFLGRGVREPASAPATRMVDAGIEVLVITSPDTMCWLTGLHVALVPRRGEHRAPAVPLHRPAAEGMHSIHDRDRVPRAVGADHVLY